MPRTFKNLQDNVLAWMADQDETSSGYIRGLVKQALDKVHRQLLTSEQLDFMLTPKDAVISVISGTQRYVLPDDFLQSLSIYHVESESFLQDVPPKQWVEAADVSIDSGDLTNVSISSVQGVKAQPETAGVVVVTASGGTELAANSIVVHGLDASGNWQEEAVVSGSPWNTLTTTMTFAHVTAIIKVGSTWTRTITATVGSVTLLTLTPTQYVKQYQQLEFKNTPTSNGTLHLRYYRKPQDLVYDHQLPDVPERFCDLLEYRALLLMPGFTRATQDEIGIWLQEVKTLDHQLKQTYQQARSLGARARRITMVPRL